MSSRARLTIAQMISVRPRTLGELSEKTGISVQAVLKHLEKLSDFGIVSEQRVSAGGMGARKLYASRGKRISDFSNGDLALVKLSRQRQHDSPPEDPVSELERLSEELLLRKRRIREQARRLERLIGEFGEDQERMASIVSSLDLTDEEKLLLHIAYSEESIDDAERAVREQHGLVDARRSLDRAISKAKRVAKK